MFYLKLLLQVVTENWLRGLAFIVFSFFLASSLILRQKLQTYLEMITPEKMVEPYITISSPNKMEATLISQLRNVVGVNDIEFVMTKHVESKVQSLISQLGAEYKLSPDILHFNAYRIKLVSNASKLTHQSVRENLKDVLKNQFVSDVKYPEIVGDIGNHAFFRFIKKIGSWGIIGIILVFWFLVFWSLKESLQARAYLVEQFQRKKNVAPKSFGAYVIGIMFISLIIYFFMHSVYLMDVIILSFVMFISWTLTFTTWEWKSLR